MDGEMARRHEAPRGPDAPGSTHSPLLAWLAEAPRGTRASRTCTHPSFYPNCAALPTVSSRTSTALRLVSATALEEFSQREWDRNDVNISRCVLGRKLARWWCYGAP